MFHVDISRGSRAMLVKDSEHPVLQKAVKLSNIFIRTTATKKPQTAYEAAAILRQHRPVSHVSSVVLLSSREWCWCELGRCEEKLAVGCLHSCLCLSTFILCHNCSIPFYRDNRKLHLGLVLRPASAAG